MPVLNHQVTGVRVEVAPEVAGILGAEWVPVDDEPVNTDNGDDDDEQAGRVDRSRKK